MSEQRPRFSFAQTAATQPERQRFSFSAAAGTKQTAPTLPNAIGSTPKKPMGFWESVNPLRPVEIRPPLAKDKQTIRGGSVIGAVADLSSRIVEDTVIGGIKTFATAKSQIQRNKGETPTPVKTPVPLSYQRAFGDEVVTQSEFTDQGTSALKRIEELDKKNPDKRTRNLFQGAVEEVFLPTIDAMDFIGFFEAGVRGARELTTSKPTKDALKKLGLGPLGDVSETGIKTQIEKRARDIGRRADLGKITAEQATKQLDEIDEAARVLSSSQSSRFGSAGEQVRRAAVGLTEERGVRESLTQLSKNPAGLSIKNVGDDAPTPRRSTPDVSPTQGVRQAVNAAGEVDLPTLPKIEQRYAGNFPEFRSAERMGELRARTRGVRTNEDSLAAARELGYTSDSIRRIPEGKALNAEEKMAVSGVVENERLVLGRMEEKLKTLDPSTDEFNVLRSEASKQKVKLFEMMAVERGVAAEAGRALQAHKATITAIERNENRLAKYLADSKTPQDTKDYIYRKIEEFDGSPDELSKLLRELDQASGLEKFVEYATAVKLWNPTTHAVNVVSSTVRMFMRTAEHAVSAAFDTVLSKLTKTERSRFLSDATAEIQGQYMGWKHAGHDAARALRDENYAFESRVLKDFEVRGPAIKGRPGKNELQDKIANGFGKAVRIPFRMLGVEDVLIRKPSEMGALYTAINRKARMEGLVPGTKSWDDYVGKAMADPVGEYGIEFMAEIQKIADENLFQESLHPILKKVSNWREDVPALKLVVPFFRTIVNLQKQALEFSLLAPILPSARKALREGGGARSDVLAKMTLGTAATIPLIHHAMEGNITMAAPNNPAERDAFYAEGKQPYSVRLGDTWYSYNRFSPFSEWFIAAGALAEAFTNEDEKSAAELTSHVFFSMTQNFFDKSFATGMHDLLEALNDPERADYWVQNFVTGATVPNFIPLWARVADPVIRETDNLRDAYISKVPYLSKTLDPKRDVFGEPISRPGNAIQKIISPVIPSPVEVDMVRDELSLIGYQMGFPGKTAGGFDMDDETYRIYQAVSGRVVYSALSQLMQNPGYQNLSPRERERAVDQIVRESREYVKTQVAQEQLIMQEIKNELKNQGYSTKQADDLAVKTYEIIKKQQLESQQQ